ncbi:MAG: transporter substrate-binding domain-containing protein [Betaproteobacteria bacterium]|nr:transporter substrate-binding domain-containing protein [Betaproteobacteria bacterium]
MALLCALAAQPALPQEAEGIETDVITEQDRAWLREHPVIRVGAEINYAPYEFQDSRGRFTGVVADYLELIQERLGVRFEVKQLPDFGAVEDKLKRRELDIVLALTPTKEREDFLSFTKPYLQYVNVIVTRDNFGFVTGLGDFDDERIAVAAGHSAQQLVSRAYPNVKVTAYSDILDALMAVSTGLEAGLVDDIFPIVYNIRYRQICNLKLATPLEKALQAKGFSIAVRKDWPELVSLLDRLLQTIGQEEQREISQKWLSLRYESKVDYRAIWTAVAFFSTLLLAAVLWIRQLNKQRRALEAAHTEAEAANRAKDEFLASMSHELRTPLHAILGYADLLREERVAGNARKDAIGTILGSGQHLLALINDLLDLSRIRTGHLELKPVTVRLRPMLEEIAAMMRVEARGKGLEFVLQLAPDLPAAVEADDRRLRQILINLLGNAIKFTDEGIVTLKVESRLVPERGAELHMVVEDTGVGIDPADKARIFAPFEQGEPGKRRESGVGLGLAISHALVSHMHGSIDVSSKPGRGSRFDLTLVLPVVDGPQSEALAEQEITGYEGPRRSILVADDQEENRNLIAQMLRPIGFEVTLASNGEEAVQVTQGSHPDLVLMDLRMPVRNGFEAAAAIRALPSVASTPIIAASASTADLARAQDDKSLFAQCLRKPFQSRELLGIIGDALQLTWRHTNEADPAPRALRP